MTETNEELAELRAEVERLRVRANVAELQRDYARMQRETAEAERDTLRRAVEALADEWQEHVDDCAGCDYVEQLEELRAVLDSHPTGTPEPGACTSCGTSPDECINPGCCEACRATAGCSHPTGTPEPTPSAGERGER